MIPIASIIRTAAIPAELDVMASEIEAMTRSFDAGTSDKVAITKKLAIMDPVQAAAKDVTTIIDGLKKAMTEKNADLNEVKKACKAMEEVLRKVQYVRNDIKILSRDLERS